jgi:hypothetical protein
MLLHRLIDFGVVAIGVVLVVTSFDGSVLTPPVLSGIAFALLGIRQFLR